MPDADFLTLRDGTTAQVRIAGPEDRNALLDFFRRLSPQSRWRRFFSAASPSPELVSFLCRNAEPRSGLSLVVTRAQAGRVRDNDIEVVSEVGLLPNGQGGFNLAVTLDIAITGVGQAKAEDIVKAAHAICPYSNAIKGNVDVKLNVATR